MKKCHLLIFCTPLIGSLLLINSAFAKTDFGKIAPEKIYSDEISDVSSQLISLKANDLTLIVFLNATGGLQGLRMNTQGVVLRISPEGRIIRKSPADRNVSIHYTDTSYQHISKVEDISILYTDASYQRVRQVGDIPISYTNTSYQHARQVGNITIQYRDTSYQEIIQVVGNQPGVEVQIEK
jgi:hypothetical protein